MVNYRRNLHPGGTFAFTVALIDRRSDLLTREINALRQALHDTKESRPFDILAAVVLPEHAHFIWQLPPGDSDYSTRWQVIKTRFNRLAGLTRSPWQPRFWEHTIRNDADFAAHVNYIHYNPVKHGLTENATDWRWSSIHRWIREGRLPPDWGCGSVPNIDFGE